MLLVLIFLSLFTAANAGFFFITKGAASQLTQRSAGSMGDTATWYNDDVCVDEGGYRMMYNAGILRLFYDPDCRSPRSTSECYVSDTQLCCVDASKQDSPKPCNFTTMTSMTINTPQYTLCKTSLIVLGSIVAVTLAMVVVICGICCRVFNEAARQRMNEETPLTAVAESKLPVYRLPEPTKLPVSDLVINV